MVVFTTTSHRIITSSHPYFGMIRIVHQTFLPDVSRRLDKLSAASMNDEGEMMHGSEHLTSPNHALKSPDFVDRVRESKPSFPSQPRSKFHRHTHRSRTKSPPYLRRYAGFCFHVIRAFTRETKELMATRCSPSRSRWGTRRLGETTSSEIMAKSIPAKVLDRESGRKKKRLRISWQI
jgi:hypothetical protein